MARRFDRVAENIRKLKHQQALARPELRRDPVFGCTDGEEPQFFKDAALAIETAMTFKRRLIALGKDRGWTHCPKCGGKLFARLLGPRQHIHMGCETENCLNLTE